MAFKKAEKAQAKLRLALVGPTGSGKTWSALKLARALVGPKGRIAVIDTERGSASLYATIVDFDVCELAPPYSPDRYIVALAEAVRDGYDAVVIDSLSHAWAAEGGVLEIVDNAAARSRSGNKFAAWREGTPQQNALVSAVLGAGAHVICTMRAKTEWVLEKDDKGREVPRKIGMAPIQRDQIEYEFTVCADLDVDHIISVSKTRCPALDRAVLRPPGNVEKIAESLATWLADGSPPAPDLVPRIDRLIAAAGDAADRDGFTALRSQFAELGTEAKRHALTEHVARLDMAFRTNSARFGEPERKTKPTTLAEATAQAKPLTDKGA